MKQYLPPLIFIALFLCFLPFYSSFEWNRIPSRNFFASPRAQRISIASSFPLYMGRAAAVRAQTKARTDAAKAKNYARFAKKILIAVKAGGPDIVKNRQLATVVADAKAANVPKDIINRNIEKGSQGVTEDYREGVYEFYGHGGAGILVNVLTDNEKRALNDISIIAKKHDLRAASMNSVAFKFAKKARFDVKGKLDEEKLLEWCLELGVDDFVLLEEINDCPLNPKEENTCVLYVDQKDMAPLRDHLRKLNYELEVKLASVPIDGFIPITEEDIERNLAAIAAIESLDDVDSIEHNMDLIINAEDVE